ncbi:MAG: hypothetical protein M1541_04295 [Acidobacteria bacterium]|nr:hypothetical protein [Acidobacteriota bacterium]
MHTRFRQISLFVLLSIMLPACSHRSAPDLQTAEQRVAQYNALLAEANRAAAAAAISLQHSGTLTAGQTGEVLAWSERIAGACKLVAQQLRSEDPWTTRAVQIRAVFEQIAPPGWKDRYTEYKPLADAIQNTVSLVQLIAREVQS